MNCRFFNPEFIQLGKVIGDKPTVLVSHAHTLEIKLMKL